jgi:hypothetical protein
LERKVKTKTKEQNPKIQNQNEESDSKIKPISKTLTKRIREIRLIRGESFRGWADFAHQGEGVAFGIFEEAHPEIVVGELGDEVRGVDEFDAAGFHLSKGSRKVGDTEVKDRAGMVVLGPGGFREHEAGLAGLEKSEIAGAEEHGELKLVLVEVDGPIGVVNGDGDLADVGDGGHGCSIAVSFH